MNKVQIERMVALSKQRRKRGLWKTFCETEGLSRHEVFHWRKKLSLSIARRRKKRLARQKAKATEDLCRMHEPPLSKTERQILYGIPEAVYG